MELYSEIKIMFDKYFANNNSGNYEQLNYKK